MNAEDVNAIAKDINEYSEKYASNISKILDKTRDQKDQALKLLQQAETALNKVKALRQDADSIEKNKEEINKAWNYTQNTISTLEERIQNLRNNSEKV